MDPKTIQYYDDHGDELFINYSRTNSGPAKYFKVAFPPGSEILDIGAGSGRDMRNMKPMARNQVIVSGNSRSRYQSLRAGFGRDILNRLLEGFDGKLTTSRYSKLAKCSQDTALRDILSLVEQGILARSPAGGRSTSYALPGIDNS